MPRHSRNMKHFEGNTVKDMEKPKFGAEGSRREVKADAKQMKPIPASPAGRSAPMKSAKGC